MDKSFIARETARLLLEVEAIQFNFSTTPGQRIRAAYRLSVNEYNGVQTPQLMIEYLENVA